MTVTRRCTQPSVARLEDRIASIPDALVHACSVALPERRGAIPKRVVTTGIGASEGPARLLACTLVEGGIAAQFVPLAAFAVRAVEGDLLVVFSQNLSPNARLALMPQHRFGARFLVTSVGLEPGPSDREALVRAYENEGGVTIVVPPASEDGMLVRVVGPAVASLVALRIAASLGTPSLAGLDFAEAADAYAKATPAPALGPEEVALVGAGISIESLHGFRWKLLETLLREDPSTWDVLQIAHGPLQAFFERPIRLLAFTTEPALGLVERLEATLDTKRHVLVRIVATRTDALAYFEHLSALDACLVATLRSSPRDLFHWPGEGIDAPLYGLGEG
jgi:hypothetical protein